MLSNLFFNLIVTLIICQKHLGMILDSRLTFNEYRENVFGKVNRGICIIHKPRSASPRLTLLTIYKSFGYLLWRDLQWVLSFKIRIATVSGLSRKKFYQKLGLETLHERRWLCRLCLFYKTQKNKLRSYLFRLIPTTNRMHITRNSNNRKGINVKHNFFKNSFFSICDKWINQARFENLWFKLFGILQRASIQFCQT